MTKNPLSRLTFTHRLTGSLPADPDRRPDSREVLGAAFSWVEPTPTAAPRLLAFSPEVMGDLGLEPEDAQHPGFLETLSGQRLAPGMQPYATCYGGHQFGYWAGQLGDGRAINLGECQTAGGNHLTLQLKGAGRTPYSRRADGRAVLRSSLREFLASEAMFHLGIPTTRALALVVTGDSVIRDMFYDGHPKAEPGAITCRVATSFTRLGHFELPAARQDLELLRAFADFSLRTEFGELGLPSTPEGYGLWFHEIVRRTARLIAEWQRVGFVHGVLNTDNLSILGLTVDYGPFGWLDHFDPDWTPNTTDAEGRRYAYGRQPAIGRWNLIRLAHALYPLTGDASTLEEGIALYDQHFKDSWQYLLGQKLGLTLAGDPDRDGWVQTLWNLLAARETDYTRFFRGLSDWDPKEISKENPRIPDFIGTAWYSPQACSPAFEAQLMEWLRGYQRRVEAENRPLTVRQSEMRAANPKFIFRNYQAQTVLDALENGDTSPFEQLFETLKRPYEDQPNRESLASLRPEWARHRAGCAMLSCSS